MDSIENPFTDLDVYCEWSGDPNDVVEVKVVVEVRCKPLAQLTVMHTRSSSIVEVRGYSLCPANPNNQTDSTRMQTTSPIVELPLDVSKSEAPHTPDNKAMKSVYWKDTATTTDANATVSFSDAGSVVMRPNVDTPNSNDDRTHSRAFLTALGIGNTSDSSPSPRNPRKRTATAASLPDSVSDSERPYGGCKPNDACKETDSPQDISPTKHLGKPSLIPRPMSLLSQNRSEPAYMPQIQDSAPELKAGFPRSEGNLLTFQRSPLPRGHNRETTGYAPTTPVTPEGGLSSLTSDGDDKCEQDMERLSTLVSRGSLSDVADGRSSSMVDLFDSDEKRGHFQSTSNSPYPQDVVVAREQTINPQLILVNGALTIHCRPDMQPAAYRITLSISVKLQKGHPKGWWELVIPDLPSLHEKDCGYLYFWTPAGQGIEFRTSNLMRYTLVESCLMGQFRVTPKLVIPLRTCDGRFYGFLKDFKVAHTVRAEVVHDKDPLFSVIKYHALCSIDLIKRDLWAEKCGFCIYVFGGPDGRFDCHLQEPQGVFQTINLDSAPDSRIGTSELEVICSPPNLAMFAVAWRVRLPRDNAITWMPGVRSSRDANSVENGLQAEFEQTEKDKIHEIVKATNRSVNQMLPSPPVKIKKPLLWSRKMVFFSCIAALSLGLALLCHFHPSWYLIGPSLPELQPVSPTIAAIHRKFDVQKQDRLTLRDKVDYLLGWRGPITYEA